MSAACLVVWCAMHQASGTAHTCSQACSTRTCGDGSGQEAQSGDRVSIDWDGYTIGVQHLLLRMVDDCIAGSLNTACLLAGYYGRPFEARNKAGRPSCLLQ